MGTKLWDLKIIVDATSKLPDAVNTSPVSLLFPLIRIQSGCGQGIIKIPGICKCTSLKFHKPFLTVVDADGDIVKCRWALQSNQECGDACQELPDNSLDRLQVRCDAQKIIIISKTILVTTYQFGVNV